jgi:hypothetical protein
MKGFSILGVLTATTIRAINLPAVGAFSSRATSSNNNRLAKVVVVEEQGLSMSKSCDEEEVHSSSARQENQRRAFLGSVLAASSSALLLLPLAANAGIDPSQLRNMAVEGDASGTVQRLREIESIQRPASDLTNMPFEELPSGVSYREYREGKGEAGTSRVIHHQNLPLSIVHHYTVLPF